MWDFTVWSSDGVMDPAPAGRLNRQGLGADELKRLSSTGVSLKIPKAPLTSADI